MNEITLLRQLHEHTPDPSEAALASARARLDQRMAAERDRVTDPRPIRHLRGRTTSIAITAAAAAAAIVVASTIGLGQPEPASASGLLRLAAGHAITASDPVVAAGQYLRVETRAAYIDWYIDASGTSAYLAPEIDAVYIPADRADTWVKTVTEIKPSRFFDPGGESAAEKDWAQGNGAATVVTRALGGRFQTAREFGGGTTPVDDLATMPRDPGALLAYLRDTLTRGEKSASPSEYPEYEFSHVASLLESGAVPADLRAGLYGALALMSGVTITDKRAALDGRTGTAFGLGKYHGRDRQELIIDPDTGEFIGEQQVMVQAYGPVPEGTVSEYTAVSVSVVNEAP